MLSSFLRPVQLRWVAIGAAAAVTLGGCVFGAAHATVSSGERDVFVPITPCRLFDTRSDQPVGSRRVPLGAGDTHIQPVRGTNGNCAIPDDAVGVAMNVTVVNGTAASFLTVWPSDASRPLASSLNWVSGASPTPNKVDVKLSASGSASFYNLAGTVDVLADVVGYYADHNFDDRYYTKAELDNRVVRLAINPFAIVPATADRSLGTVLGCVDIAGGMGSPNEIGVLPLELPIGTRLIHVDIETFKFAVGDLHFDLVENVVGTDSATGTVVATAKGTMGPGPTTFFTLRLTPSSTVTVDEYENFALVLFGIGHTGSSAICSVVVEYDPPP